MVGPWHRRHEYAEIGTGAIQVDPVVGTVAVDCLRDAPSSIPARAQWLVRSRLEWVARVLVGHSARYNPAHSAVVHRDHGGLSEACVGARRVAV